MKSRLMIAAPLALILALSACTPASPPSGAGAQATIPPTATAPPTAAVEVPTTQATLQPVRTAVPPVRVRVPGVGIDAEVVPVGVEPNGAMELPVDPAIAGWYRFGPDPGSADGNTVVSAHIDAVGYPIGPFSRLRDLGGGAEVVVSSADGTETRYSVVSVTYYPKKELPVDQLFARTGTKALILITCGGAFDSGTGSYADNVVVVASPVT